jgi:uncharacterized protein DUF1566
MQSTWIRRIGIVALVGGFCLVGYRPAPAAPPVKDDSLAGVTQNWDKNLPSASRFTVLANFGGAAVRDNNTGLVWEQTADGTTRTWTEATAYCVNKAVGGTVGWRLPSVVELNSVRDPSLTGVYVPAIFSGVQNKGLWSGTTVAGNSIDAWLVDFSGGVVVIFTKGTSAWAWCVRGPMNADAY